MNWHDATTGLPPEGTRVLVWIDQYQEIGTAYLDDRGRWRHDDGAIFQDYQITYWQSLPGRPLAGATNE